MSALSLQYNIQATMLDNEHEFPIDKSEAAVNATLSQRLREARDLCRFSMTEAAELLGITRDELVAYEQRSSVRIPLKIVKLAALRYDVSADFLVGVVDEEWELAPEVRQQRDIYTTMLRVFSEQQAPGIVAQLKLENKVSALTNAVEKLAPAIKNVYEKILRMWELSKDDFEGLPGSNPVIVALSDAVRASHAATCELARFKALPFDALAAYDPDSEPPFAEMMAGPKPATRPVRNVNVNAEC